jgi:hypothetical protein
MELRFLFPEIFIMLFQRQSPACALWRIANRFRRRTGNGFYRKMPLVLVGNAVFGKVCF